MAIARYSLWTYQQANNILPILVGVVTLILVILLIAYTVVSAVLKYRKSATILPGRALVFATSKFILGGAVERKEELYFLFEKEIDLFSLHIFSIAAPFVLCATFFTFWGVFLIQESFRCETDIDCFPINATDGTYIQQQPITNCTSFETQENVTFECYEFVFRYAEGFGAAGGVIVLAPGIIEVYVGLLIYIFNFGERGGKIRRYCTYFITILLVSIPLGMVIGTLHVAINVEMINEIFFRTTESSLQFAAYYIILFWTFFLAIQVLVIIRRSKKKHNPKDDHETQPQDSTAKLSSYSQKDDDLKLQSPNSDKSRELKQSLLTN